jgi:non-specific serine/threonine protein kinase
MTITNISHYQITGTLGRGGMGVVYKAIDQKLQRPVAIKSLLPESLGDEKLKQRLMSEARAASRLNHPNICTIYEVDEADGILFIAMEYVTGETLSEEIRKGPIEIERGLDIGLQIAAGLDQAHRANIIHRDIKPANIVLPHDGPVKILDFGIARVLKRMDGDSPSEALTLHANVTEPGQLVGTAAYMSPEQLNGEDVDARTDVFAFGVLLYEMLSGQPPFSGASLLQLMGSILNDEPQPLSRKNNTLPRALDRIIAKALAKNREQRYATMKDLRQDLLKLKDQLQRTTPANEQESIAVLYFENLSGAGEQEYLRDGMTEDIITELSKVERLRVFPRSAVMSYRDKEVTAPEIGRHLNASHVLSGSLRHAGNRVRISAQLIESSGGHTVWAERYDREMHDVFALQDEIARSIARALRIKLSPQEEAAIARKPVANPEAYDYYLRGRRFFRRGTKKDMHSAAEMFEHAVALDPNFALAYAGLGHVFGRIHRYSDQNPVWVKKGIEACEQAMRLEPHLPEALSARAFLFYAHEEYELAIQYARMALERKEDCEGAYFTLGSSLFVTDRLNEAAELAERAIEVSGDDYNVYLPYTSVFRKLKETEKVDRLRQQQTRVLQWQIEWAPENVRARILLAGNLANVGDIPNSVAELEKAVAASPHDPSTLYNAACGYAVMGLKEEALSMLNQAVKNGYWHFDLIARDPDFENLHDEPAFQQLLSAQGAG